MSFPRYPEYKDSGVEWLGQVPGHWGVGQSRRLFALRNERAFDTDKQLTASQVHGVIYQEDFVRLEGRKVVEVIKGADILKHVEPNDFVISMRSFQGGIEWSQVRGCISSAYVMLNPCDRIHAPFFQYLLKSQSYIQALQTTSNLVRDGQALRYDNFSQVDLPLVSLDEQSQIAAFLDHETTKIDALVAEQRRLMELLKEKRQAVISHAVTKGLNPDAPMKPSGIEWLGDVPEHWEVWKIAHAFAQIGSGTTPKTDNRAYYDGGDIAWVNTGDLNDGILNDCEKRITALAIADNSTLKTYPPGSLLIAMYGATIGKLGILTFAATVNQACCVLSGWSEIDAKFMFFWFLGFRHQIISLATGGGQPNISQEILRSLRLACPGKNEQSKIADFLDTESAKFDALTAEAQRAIDLLQERRTALISAAVTGQIDVRGVALNSHPHGA